MNNYEASIGLEIHVQINTKSKLFCECPTSFGEIPNSNICVICTSQPGVLPILNKKAVEAVIKTGLALNARINKKCFFARKQYFYPDIPKNYQITQFEYPICQEGKLILITSNIQKVINITRIHLEEDAGKLIHEFGNKKLDYSLLDLNRAGIGLMEIVTEPEINSANEAATFLNQLKNIIEYLNTSECNMEEGNMRCDVNVSLRNIVDKKLGTKIEIKNMNSISGIKDAITYEINRQRYILESRRKIKQETRLWDSNRKVTRSMRDKENTLDYRYFIDPNLIPITITETLIKNLNSEIPELPILKKNRFYKEYLLNEYDINFLVSDKNIADYFEKTVFFSKNKKRATKIIANWIITDLMTKLNENKLSIKESPINCENMAKLIDLIINGDISNKIARMIFEDMYIKSSDPRNILREKKLLQISDKKCLTEICNKAIIKNSKAALEFKNGKQKAIYAIVGFVMKETKGCANPKLINSILLELLTK
ncbi:MAG: Asp-tRNA(Asn)/Glu-tRNA(Gln) amidotransferase subunit GatB [Endomicrobium sp.]|jgi:aspartyl-tRNA(Asn)/glutamyl-tRNA(Gln) amidotransferase subunit B|nr:Asp-tRNA(Asn)/Glu-tRNA(Gln) amidotransferase subunit GatB [Endomicrobium sp.]